MADGHWIKYRGSSTYDVDWEQFLEAKGQTDELKAITELAKAIQGVFRRFARPVRQKAWDKLLTKKGLKEVEALLRTPEKEHSLSGFRTL